MVTCACGCNQEFEPSRATLWRLKTGRINAAFIRGHETKGINNNRWKGGRTMSAQGYIMVRLEGHPNARKGGYILEHRLVMSQHLGRPLLDTEIVHHKNGDKLDNRIENLEITDRPKHAEYHLKERANPVRRVKYVMASCLNCGISLIVRPGTPARPRQKYCSKACQQAHKRGANASHVQLTVAEVRAIRALDGILTHKEIAEKFNVKRGTVSSIIARRSWKDIP